MSKVQVSTVASMARHVSPSGLDHPLPRTVTGPMELLRKRFLEDAVTSHETPECFVSLILSATTASCEMRVDVTPLLEPAVGLFLFLVENNLVHNRLRVRVGVPVCVFC